MAINTIVSTKPITITQGLTQAVYDHVCIQSAHLIRSIHGHGQVRVSFAYCKMVNGLPVFAPMPTKQLVIKDVTSIQTDPAMAAASATFFSKLVTIALAQGIIS
jgi:hypothetical protein